MSTYSIFRTLTISRYQILASRLVTPHLIATSVPSSSRHASAAPVARLTGDKIPHPYVRVVNSETGKLEPVTSLKSLIASLDKKVWLVELVSEKPEPLVKIVDRKESFRKLKEQQRAHRAGIKASAQKEIQVTWGVGAGDLEHKLAKARSELEKGYRVDIVIAPKKRQPLPKPSEMEARANEMAATLADIAKEWKARDVQKTITVMSFQKLPQTPS
ncbi:hypothetical protein BV22DRAFT_1090180 [Leucogyrophana mollusca]|uniref:Uncharacterized protein n=1 Tax=Leucogyrophana mollusca TaxID=85980 RepID=A0ACB8BGJ1_9AGAM|nr:hypothetical protein BV22DRAFT_1090180 [Leucogyrophana mollusca]